MGAERFDNWIVERPLGGGGQGQTYLVYKEDDPGEKFVLKKLTNLNRIERFKVEIKAGLELEHPYIIKVRDHSLEGKKPYLVTDFCEGGDLSNSNVHNLSLLDRLGVFLAICRGVGEAHKKGIVHRDIKPANIFLLSDEITPIVGDFGLCYVISEEERHTKLYEVVGPRWFTAPELMHGFLEKVSPTADVYSFGKLLYWLASSRSGFFDRERHREERWNLLTDCRSPDLFFIYDHLDKMIVEDPSKRYSDANEVADAIAVTIKRIKMNAHHIDLSTPQACTYCGIGYYNVVLNASPETKGANLISSIQNFGFYGGQHSPTWLIWACSYCGHLQIFRPDCAAENIWKKK